MKPVTLVVANAEDEEIGRTVKNFDHSTSDYHKILTSIYQNFLDARIIILLLYLAWYLWIVINFTLPADTAPVKWGTSILLSVFVGTALNINAYIPPFEEHISLRRWAIFRFYIIPFCVSSYSNVSFYYNFIALFPVHDYVTGVIGIGFVVGLGIILVVIRWYVETALESRIREEEIHSN